MAATDANSDRLVYTIENARTSPFTVVRAIGQLRVGQPLDYEAKSSYTVTVSVRDSKDADGNKDTAVDATQNVTITLTNLEEAGTVTLSPTQPSARAQITATLTDPDESIAGTARQRAKSSDGNTGWSIVGANSDSYTPVDGDITSFLRATASYTDGRGANKTANAVTTHVVRSGTNRAPDFGANPASRSFPENADVGYDIGSPVTATDDDSDTLTCTLEGTDKDSFQIVSTSGQIQTKSGVTYDHETDDSYSVTVKADDKKADPTPST